jgi:uncharacterized membrane protein YgaE (UPF0421/DUF939 family)
MARFHRLKHGHRGSFPVAGAGDRSACYECEVSDPGTARRERILTDLQMRVRRSRLEALPTVQAGVAAGIAWFVAADVLNHRAPFFAPIAALIVLGNAAGRRWRRAAEMVVGVALGIAVGDLIILVIGVGPAQIAVVVVLAIMISIFLGVGNVFAGQAASSAVLVAAFSAPSGGGDFFTNRVLDALVGGTVGLVVMAIIPFNPLTKVKHDAGVALSLLAEALTAAAEALESHSLGRARRSLDALRQSADEYQSFEESLSTGQETAAVSPLRWSARSELLRYVDSAAHIERATRNVRVMQHWIVAVLRDKEPVPSTLPQALRTLSKAVGTLRREIGEAAASMKTRELVRQAVQQAWSAYAEGVGFAGGVVVAQVRGAAVDLLVAAGLPPAQAETAVREAATPRGQDDG